MVKKLCQKNLLRKLEKEEYQLGQDRRLYPGMDNGKRARHLLRRTLFPLLGHLIVLLLLRTEAL